ncbi:MAG: hypothetical protein R3F62_24380 [Planctomycetota bacterium]
MKLYLCAAALCASAASALADDGGAFVPLNQLREAARGERWSEVVARYRELLDTPSGRDATVRFLYARAELELGALASAESALGDLLTDVPQHTRALALLAQVRATQAARAEGLEREALAVQARDALLAAAAAGHHVTRDLATPDGERLFPGALEDAGFVLELLRAARARTLGGGALRDPFSSPLRREAEEPPPEREVPLDLEALEAKIRAFHQELTELARAEDYAALEGRIEAFGDFLTRIGPEASAASRRLRQDGEVWLGEFRAVLAMVRLQEHVAEGNACLRAMWRAVEAEAFPEVLDGFAQLEAHCASMREAEDPAFARNAEQLLLRGRALAEKARVQVEIAALRLEVTGIVIASTAASQGAARAYDTAIVNDRILRVGDPVVTDTAHDAPHPGLRLVAIGASGTTVTFAYEGVEFLRGLGAQREE